MVYWFTAVSVAAAHALVSHHTMNPDGISYLDIADAYFRRDWSNAINAYWSPLYSWVLGFVLSVLKPHRADEYQVIQWINFLIYLVTCGCFFFLLRQLGNGAATGATEDSQQRPLPEWSIYALGSGIHFVAAVRWIDIATVTPDMCVAAIVYVAAGLLLRVASAQSSARDSILLGGALGLGYLCKGALFPLGFVFLAVAAAGVRRFRRGTAGPIMALGVFALVAGPFVGALSIARGHLTFSETARLNYAWCVNRWTSSVHWQGREPGSGRPAHPTRNICSSPAVYEFGSPVGGTYAPWYDPPYWNDGITPHFNLKDQLRTVARSMKDLFVFLSPESLALFVAAIVLLSLRGDARRVVDDVARQWLLLVPGLAAVVLYSLVHVESRLIAPFVVLCWLGVFNAVRLPYSECARRTVGGATAGLVAALALSLTGFLLLEFRDHSPGTAVPPAQHRAIAAGLREAGLRPGDRVGFIGRSLEAYWARLAGVRIVVEIPGPHEQFDEHEVEKFWAAPPSVRSQVLRLFRDSGAKAVVAELPLTFADAGGWRRIEGSRYSFQILADPH